MLEERAMKNYKTTLAIALLVGSFIIPLAGFWVASLSISAAAKAVIIGLLTVGGPELLVVAAIALVGKEGFQAAKSKVLSLWKKPAPDIVERATLKRLQITQ